MRALFASGLLVLVSGCSASRPVTFSTTGDEGGGGATSAGGSAGTGGTGGSSATTGGGGQGGGGIGGLGGFGGQGGGTPVGETEVFGHSADTLYKLDPIT